MFSRYVCLLLFASVPIVRPLAQDSSKAVLLSGCSFHRDGDHFDGSCGSLFHQNPQMTLRSATAMTSGVWRNDKKPISVWSGDMTDSGYPNEPMELEVYSGDWGVLRTEYGWFPVSGFVAADSTLNFKLDASQEVAPSALDLKIVQKAAEILATEDAWNRADNRKCPANASKWSIYCALERAEVEVTGGLHHRRPAAEIVREIVDERTASRNYHHRLIEYNNDATTHLQDVQSLFLEAEAKIKKSPIVEVSTN
jgi:hypothetical protein